MPLLRSIPAIYVGDKIATKAYIGATQVWPDAPLVSVVAQQNSGTWNGTDLTVTLPLAPATTSTLVLITAGGSAVNLPNDWVQRTTQSNWIVHSLYTLTGTTTASWAVTTPGSVGTWWLAEVTHASYDVAASGNQTSGANTYVTPDITPTAGQRMLIGSLASISDNASVRTVSSWTNGFSEQTDICVNAVDYPMQGVANSIVTADGVSPYSTGVTYSTNAIGRSAIICSLVVAGSSAPGGGGGEEGDDLTAPTIPTNLTALPAATSVFLAWGASNDNVAVAGYEYSLNNTTYLGTGSTATSYVVAHLRSSTDYILYVRAYDAAGNRSGAVSVSVTTSAGEEIQESSLALPLEPWHGGPAYYDQFPVAVARGWSDVSFFPFAMFPNSFDNDSQVAWDSQISNVYHNANPWSTWSDLPAHNMSWIGGQLDSVYDGLMPTNFAPWVAFGIEDEIDGTSELPQDGLDRIGDQIATFPQDTGRFVFANYTQRVLQTAWTKPGGGYWGQDFVNYPGVDVICIDMYWYTVPDSSFNNGYVPGGDTVKGPGARSAGSYGASIRALRWLDAQDDHLKPVWMYIENLSGSPGENFVRYIDPLELKAAVMSCITNGASGVVWFNNVASSEQYVGNVARTAQLNPGHPAVSRVQAAKEIKEFVGSLAPVINSQSYVWDFGASTIDTMLKAYDGFAYIFAIPGTGEGSGPTLGAKTFQLPVGLSGVAEVLGEGRTITIADGQLTDTFPYEYTYHVYKIPVTG